MVTLGISGDGRILALVDNVGQDVYIWNTQSGSLRKLRLTMREAEHRYISVSLDGRYVALPEINRGMEIYNTQTLKPVVYLQEDYAFENLVIWASGSQNILVGISHWVKVWDVEAIEEQRSYAPSGPSEPSPASGDGGPHVG